MHLTHQFSTIFSSSYSFINPKFPNFNHTSHKFKTFFSYQSPNSLHDANLNHPDTKISSFTKTLKSNIDAENTINNISNPETAILALRYLPDKTEPDTRVTVYNIVFKLYREIKDFDKAENLFDEMLQRGLKPNTLTFSNLIRCAALCGLSHKAVELFEMMPAFGCEPDNHVFSSMIFVYADIGNVDMALKLYDIVKNEKWLIGAVAFSALIKMYQLLGNYDGCLSVYNDMKVLGVKPNKLVYNTLLAAMQRDKRARNANEVYQEMRKAKRTDDVVKMFNQLWDIGISPDDRLCDCLLYVMTQIPKEELGKITNCIEKANPKLRNILTYLMEEKEDDGYFMKEISEFLSAAHEQVKMSLCNNLIDICYNLGVEDKGCDILGLGLWLEIYSDIQSRSESQWCLDLNQFSVGAAITALHVWLDELSKAFESGEELPHVLGICWRRKPSNKDLACVFELYLKELNSPFYKDTDTNGWFFTTIQEAKSWLQSRSSNETVADLTSTVLDVPINLSSILNPITQPLDSLEHAQLEYPDAKSSPNENRIYEIVKGFGDNVTEHDDGFILNNMSKLDDAMLVFKYHMKKVEPGKQVILYNAMLKLLKECGEFEKAEKLFDEMLQLKIKPDIITFSTMISYAGLCAEHRKAVKWFEMMPSFKCKPDDNLLSIMISSNASIGNVDMASRLYYWAKKKKWKVDEVACSALIKIYGKSGNYDGCLRVYSDMKVFGVKPNMATYKELLCAMGRGKRASEAKAIHEEMINNGISPNQSTYEAVLQAYCRGMYKVDALIVYKEMKKRASEAKAIYEEMINNGISPNQSTYEAVLQAYCRAMYKVEALIVYKEMKEKGMDIGRDLYHMLLDLCADVGYADEAVEIFQDMKSSGTCHPDSVTYASLIKVYSHTRNVSEAEAMLKEMMNCGLEPNLLVLTSLAGCYGRAKQTDDVVRIFDQLLDLGLCPDDCFSACLVHVMAQIPKQEHGRILDCIEKAKPKLGFVIRYLMEERDDDRIFFKEASELFNSIDDFVIKKSMCRSLIDLCVNLEVPNRARDLFNLGLTLELYTNMQNRSQTMWSLHVKNLTIGTTLTALQVWMDDLSNALESGEELPPVLGIYTKKNDKSKLSVIESYLKEHNAPFQLFPKNNNNGFLATTELAKSWLQSRVLDVPAIVVES